MLLAMMKHVLIIVFLLQIIGVHHESRCNKRNRTPDTELPYHAKRRRVSWTALVRNLGPLEFHRHHRVSVALFNKIHDRILPHIATKDKYARRSCCRGSVSAVDSRSRLSMLLKHLAGSKMQDIERCESFNGDRIHCKRHGCNRERISYSRFSFRRPRRIEKISWRLPTQIQRRFIR